MASFFFAPRPAVETAASPAGDADLAHQEAFVRAELIRRLPFETHVVLCEGRDLLRLETEHPFGREAPERDVVRFVSILSSTRARIDVPIFLPDEAEWLVHVLAVQGRFVFGTYRRHMRTIGWLGRLDRLLGVPATTRNWNTILRVVEILKRGTSD